MLWAWRLPATAGSRLGCWWGGGRSFLAASRPGIQTHGGRYHWWSLPRGISPSGCPAPSQPWGAPGGVRAAFGLSMCSCKRSWGRPCRLSRLERRWQLGLICTSCGIVGLEVTAWDPEEGPAVTPQKGAHERVVRAAAMAALKNSLAAGSFAELAFRPASTVGEHALRIAARVRVVQGIAFGMNDVERSDRIDLEVQSAKVWAKWRQSLTRSSNGISASRRQGAVWTSHAAQEGWCPDRVRLVRARWASARHFRAECPGLARDRQAIGRRAGLPVGRWEAQPRIASKSAWIAGQAGPSPERQAEMQTAAWQMVKWAFRWWNRPGQP